MLGINEDKKKGLRCEPLFDESGASVAERCRVAKNHKGQLLATATDFGFSIDTTTCEPHWVGPHTIMEEDKEMVEAHVKGRVQACRVGLFQTS